MTYEMWQPPGLAPTCVQASRNRCVVMMSTSSVDRLLSRGNRDRDLDSVKIQCERQSLYVYLEQKAKLVVQGECSAQKRLSEAQPDMEVREREMRSSD